MSLRLQHDPGRLLSLAFLVLLTPLVAGGGIARAGFRIPSTVYRADRFQEARAEAARSGRPVAILCSNEKSRCGLCGDATMSMIREYRSQAVLVYAKHEEIGAMPSIVARAINSREAGVYIPKMAIFDSSFTRTIAILPFRWRNEQRLPLPLYRSAAAHQLRETRIASARF